jgi:hypothetical protein
LDLERQFEQHRRALVLELDVTMANGCLSCTSMENVAVQWLDIKLAGFEESRKGVFAHGPDADVSRIRKSSNLRPHPSLPHQKFRSHRPYHQCRQWHQYKPAGHVDWLLGPYVHLPMHSRGHPRFVRVAVAQHCILIARLDRSTEFITAPAYSR